MKSGDTVYLVYQDLGEGTGEDRWELQGVFTTESKAIDACVEENYGYGPMVLDVLLPKEKIEWEGYRYPLLEGKTS